MDRGTLAMSTAVLGPAFSGRRGRLPSWRSGPLSLRKRSPGSLSPGLQHNTASVGDCMDTLLGVDLSVECLSGALSSPGSNKRACLCSSNAAQTATPCRQPEPVNDTAVQDCSSCCEWTVCLITQARSVIDSQAIRDLSRTGPHPPKRADTGHSTTVILHGPALEDPAAIPAAAVPVVALPGAWRAPASMLNSFTCRWPFCQSFAWPVCGPPSSVYSPHVILLSPCRLLQSPGAWPCMEQSTGCGVHGKTLSEDLGPRI